MTDPCCISAAHGLACTCHEVAERDALMTELAAVRERAEKAEASEADAVAEYHSIRRELSDMRQRAEKAEAVADRLWMAFMWIDTSAPEITAAAETKFGLDISRATLRQDEGGE